MQSDVTAARLDSDRLQSLYTAASGSVDVLTRTAELLQTKLATATATAADMRSLWQRELETATVVKQRNEVRCLAGGRTRGQCDTARVRVQTLTYDLDACRKSLDDMRRQVLLAPQVCADVDAGAVSCRE